MGMNSLPNPRPTMAMFSFSRFTFPGSPGPLIGQSKGYISVAGLCSLFAAAAARDDYVLLAIYLVNGRGGNTSGGQIGLPEQFSCRLIERPDFFVPRGSDEDEADRCNHRRPEIFSARVDP